MPRNRNADQVAVADDAVGRIEIHPPCTGQIDLQPRVGRATADHSDVGRFGTKM